MEERIRDLEKEVNDVRTSNAILGHSVDQLSKSVDQLTNVVQDLRDTMNKGRGALWAVTGAGGLFGAGAQYLGVVRVVAGASVCRIYFQVTDTTIGEMTPASPLTFASTDNLRFNCRYRVN